MPIPYKKLLDKIKGSIRTYGSYVDGKRFPIHQRSVAGDIIYIGKPRPVVPRANIQSEIEDLIDVFYKKYGTHKDDINCGSCLPFAEHLRDRVGGVVVGREDGTHYWLLWKGKYYDSDNPNGVKHLENLKFWQGERGSWDYSRRSGDGDDRGSHKPKRSLKTLDKKKI